MKACAGVYIKHFFLQMAVRKGSYCHCANASHCGAARSMSCRTTTWACIASQRQNYRELLLPLPASSTHCPYRPAGFAAVSAPRFARRNRVA